MKEQILRGLLRAINRCEERESANDALGAGAQMQVAQSVPGSGALGNEGGLLDDERKRREDLVRTGAVTPLDDFLSGPTLVSPRRPRMTLMDHKVAEGMSVKLPRSRRTHTRARTGTSDQAESRDDSGGEDNAISFSESKTATGGDSMLQARTDSERWACHMCTLLCPLDAIECPACGEQRPRKLKPASAPQSTEKGITEQAWKGSSRGVEARGRKDCTIECPVCAQDVKIEDPASPDVSLSKHMDRCSRRSRRRQSRRQNGDYDGHTGGNGNHILETCCIHNVLARPGSRCV